MALHIKIDLHNNYMIIVLLKITDRFTMLALDDFSRTGRTLVDLARTMEQDVPWNSDYPGNLLEVLTQH